ncbi:MAG: SNF2 helicase associated domain-containing protein, partial [Bacteroidia bacterium]
MSKPLCKHGYALVYSMANQMKCPEDALFPLRNHDDKIAEKLAEYGFALEDKWQDFFDIEIYFHSVELIPKDPGLSKIAAFSDWKNEISFYIDSNHEIDPEAFRATRSDYGILWNYDHKGSAHIFLNLLTGKRKKNGELGAPLRIHSSQDMNEDELSKDQLEIIDLLRRAKVAHKVYDYSHWGYSSRNQDVEIEDLIAHFNRINEVYDQLLVEEHYFSVEPQNRNTVASRHTRKIFPQAGRLSLQFEFRKGPNHFLLKPLVTIDEVVIPLHKLEAIDYGVYLLSDNLYLLDKKSARVAMFFLNKKAYRIRHEDLEPFAEQFLLPLMEQFPINMVGDHLKIEEREGIIGRKLYLKEVEEYLLFIPSITYEIAKGVTREVYFDGGNSLSYKDKDGQLYSISRNQEEEKEVWEKLVALHPKFAQTQDHYFSLPIDKVMYQNWFFDAFAKFRELGFEVLGLKELKKMAYNPHRPTIRLQASSGTDWFDLDIEVSFGGQKVKLSDIRKAILNNQQYVKLGDGSIGMLPEEWLKKYSTLFKVGKTNRGKLKISEFQVNVVDEIYEEIENGEVFREILEKRERL